jgi:two-component system sensor histidine kinase SenX3
MLRLVAHELRAHITVLDGYAELLGDAVARGDPERSAVAAAAIRSQLAALRQMAAHLVESVDGRLPDRLAFQPGELDLAAAAAQAVALCQGTAHAHRVTLVCDSEAVGDPVVHGDAFHLVTAMRNLLENACRYGPRGGTVRLSLARRDDQVEVLAHDQGSGLRRVGQAAFEPYQRGLRADEQEPGGLGLGLSLVAQVAQLHGGVALWGDEPDGAVIGFRFPTPRPVAAG